MVINRANKVGNKPLVNYGEVVFRRNDVIEDEIPDLGALLSSTSDGGSGETNNDDEATAKAEAEAKAEADAKAKAEAEKLDSNDNPSPDSNDDDENKETDDEFKARLLETYKGDGFNENGDIVLEDGTIVKKVDEIVEYQSNDEQTLVSEIQTTLGYEINDDEGNPKQYEDSVEGVSHLIQDVADIAANEKIDNFISTFPELKSLYNHLSTGGTVSNFVTTEKDWSDVTLSNDDKDLSKNVIREDFTNKGFDPKVIEQMITGFEDSGMLLETANSSKEALKVYKTERDRAMELEIANKAKAEQEKIASYWNKAKEVINTGQLKDTLIPQKDRGSFFDYVSKAVDNNGNSQESLDRANEDMETRMLMSYWRYNKYDISKLVKSLVAQEKADSLRQRISTRQTQTTRPIIKGKMGSANDVDFELGKFI